MGVAIAAVGHEGEPFAVGDQRARDAHGLDQLLVRGRLVVEAIAGAFMADLVDAGGEFDEPFAAFGARRLPVRIVRGIGRVQREGVENVGEHQLLMLLLVVQPDLEHAEDFRKCRRFRFGDQPLDRGVHVGAVGGDFFVGRAGDEAALWARVARAGGDVIRVEQEGEARVENLVAGDLLGEQELLEEPGGMRAMPLDRAGVGHRLDDLVLGRERRRAALGLRAHGAERVAPASAQLVGLRRAARAAGGMRITLRRPEP